jgi:hypothetical protein
VTLDGREHVEYVPTQIVTEYFRRVFPQENDGVVDGLLYRSSRRDGTCCVVFAKSSDVADADGEALLLLCEQERRDRAGQRI